MPETIVFLYINGLGDGKTTFKDKVIERWWKRAGIDLLHSHTNWYDEASFDDKLLVVEQKVDEMLDTYSGVALIGSSAGGSLAVNAFHKLKGRNVCAIVAHGRLRAGNYSDYHRMSLYHRAHLDTNKPSQSFFDGVAYAENITIPALTDQDKQRILVLSQLTDLVVPKDSMGIEGVQEHRSITFGHIGGFIAHLLACRGVIADFAQSSLNGSNQCAIEGFNKPQ